MSAALPSALALRFMMAKILFFTCAVVCLLPFMDAGLGLLLGFTLALTTRLPFSGGRQTSAHYLLQVSVVGLGFGLNAHSALQAGRSGLFLTIASIGSALSFGVWLGKRLQIGRKAAYLI